MSRQQCLLLQALFLMSCSGSSSSFGPPGSFSRVFCCCHCSVSHFQSRTPLCILHSVLCSRTLCGVLLSRYQPAWKGTKGKGAFNQTKFCL